MAYRAVIFDRDGVLTDFDLVAAEAFFGQRVPLTLTEIFDRWEQWGQQCGFPTSLAEEKCFFAEFWDALCDELTLPEQIRCDLHTFDYTTCLSAFSDSAPALMLAQNAGMAVGVLSNFTLASLDASLHTVGLTPWIDAACGATVIGVAKPAPQAYRIAAARLGADPNNCLFFDDEPECVEGARRVGMTAFLVDRRRDAHDLPGAVVANLDALREILNLSCD